MKENGLVGCVCLTYKNIDMFRNAVRCFKEQTYKNKVLIVIDNSSIVLRDYKMKVLNILDEEKVEKYHYHKLPENKTIGEYRQAGLKDCELLNCRYMATWDDDDLCGKDRLKNQIAELKDGKTMCFLQNFVIRYAFKQKLDFLCRMENGLACTMVCDLSANTESVYFKNKRIGEDVDFWDDWRDFYGNESVVYMGNNPSDYTYIGHGTNVTGFRHFTDLIDRYKID